MKQQQQQHRKGNVLMTQASLLRSLVSYSSPDVQTKRSCFVQATVQCCALYSCARLLPIAVGQRYAVCLEVLNKDD